MAKRQQARADETRQAILQAAGRLFGQRGYESVTMREIAREAGCSHTAIYLYFKDKEALLHQLAIGPLTELESELDAALRDESLTPSDRLAAMGRTFIRFGLTHRNSYHVLFMARAERVDVEAPELAVNALRNRLFGLLRQAVADLLPPGASADSTLAYARVVFYHLHGIVETYRLSPEDLPSLMERLGGTFALSLEVLLKGIEQTARRG
ncbi:MAG: TetR/AcrR family transcriptional regulator [Symbiobacterium sp.]|uniref:TetR/AcrR family transcriptional regulator n=1 Tax=Symbiobacterium sp. TaxID=1971213 RepID=UPI003464536C